MYSRSRLFSISQELERERGREKAAQSRYNIFPFVCLNERILDVISSGPYLVGLKRASNRFQIDYGFI
jgi:hypothetical protein